MFQWSIKDDEHLMPAFNDVRKMLQKNGTT